MSNFTFGNLASLARSKLHSALSSGTRDSGSLHRWVLLKNSILHNRDDDNNTPVTQKDSFGEDYTEEDSTDAADEYEDVFSFLFPDPGDSSPEHVDDSSVTEAQWLDSLLESLGEDDEEQANTFGNEVYGNGDNYNGQIISDIACTMFKANGDVISPRTVIQYPVPYPPLHPPLVQRYNSDFYADSSYFSTSTSDSSFPPSPIGPLSFHDSRGRYCYTPDAIEDASDDDTEAPTTPFSRSRSSLHSVDPAKGPLPNDQTQVKMQPFVYNEVEEAFFRPFQLDPLPYANYYESSHFPSQYHQNC